MPSPLPALHKHLINCPFIYFPCRALRPARGPASQRPSLHGTRAALCAQGYGPPPGPMWRPRPPGRKERAPGPLPVGSGQAGRPRPSRPAACAQGRRGRSTNNAAGRGAEAAGGAGSGARGTQASLAGSAPGASAAARGLSARGRGRLEPGAPSAAAGGEGAAAGGGSGRRGGGGGGRRKGAGPRSCWALGRLAGGRTGCGPAGGAGRGWASLRGGGS